MLKTSMMMLTAMVLVGVSEAGDRSTEPQGTFQLAHVSQWSHYHQCNPSPCPKLRDRHKKGTGSVTE
jgi:hypothetical protein